MYWARRSFEGEDYEPYLQRLHELLIKHPSQYREILMVSSATSARNDAEYYVGLPEFAFLALFDGFELIPETALPKTIDTIHLADTTTNEFNNRFRFRRWRSDWPPDDQSPHLRAR